MSLFNQRGTVMYVCRNSVQHFMALRYDGAAVIVTGSLMRRDFQADDIVEFDASSISRADASLYKTVNPKWMASRVKFVKHAQTFTGSGKILNIDPKGEYCFVESQQGGTNYNVFCTRISIQPLVQNIHTMFTTGNHIKFFAKEQVPNAKNNNVKWRTVVATDAKHDLKPKKIGAVDTFEAVPIVAAPRPVPKLRMAAPSANAVRPPNAAAAVKGPQAAAAPAPPPSPGPPGAPIARRTSENGGISQNNAHIPKPIEVQPPVAPTAPTAVAAQRERRVSSQEQENQNNGGISHAPPPGIVAPPANLSSHPMPSYEWMKFDLISTLQSYPDPKGNQLQEESQKLRAIAHHLTDNLCNFCLSH